MEKALGIDISVYDYDPKGIVKVNFEMIRDYPVHFIAIRAAISWGYVDKWFRYGWEEAAAKKINRIAYHVPYFGEPTLKQMDNLFGAVHGSNWDHDILCLDCELVHANTKEQITAATRSMMEICKSRTGKYPILYSRALWVNENMIVSALPGETEWWLAQYLYKVKYPAYTAEHKGPPTLPKGVKSWLIHQTAEAAPGIGTYSYYCDWNRWNGDAEAVNKYFGVKTEIVIPSIEERLSRLEEWIEKHENNS